ncbi:hypothetical protein DXG01_003792 [Tephrocybe rancida]|nr:hypothetical protein DXG01_003792 [Tephrocybe rancida]
MSLERDGFVIVDASQTGHGKDTEWVPPDSLVLGALKPGLSGGLSSVLSSSHLTPHTSFASSSSSSLPSYVTANNSFASTTSTTSYFTANTSFASISSSSQVPDKRAFASSPSASPINGGSCEAGLQNGPDEWLLKNGQTRRVLSVASSESVANKRGIMLKNITEREVESLLNSRDLFGENNNFDMDVESEPESSEESDDDCPMEEDPVTAPTTYHYGATNAGDKDVVRSMTGPSRPAMRTGTEIVDPATIFRSASTPNDTGSQRRATIAQTSHGDMDHLTNVDHSRLAHEQR